MEISEKKSLDKEAQCPLCDQQIILNVVDENIHCNSCKQNYIYKYCPECDSIIYFRPMYYDGYNIQCPYISCHSISCSVKCIKCNKKIFFTSNYKYFQGDTVECKECQISFKKIKCPYKTCKETIKVEKNEKFFEGNQLKCLHNNIPYTFQKVGCWFCGRHCVWDNTKNKIYIEGQEIICPYPECQHVTNKVTCPKCLSSSYITKANLEMGKKINCLIKNCNYTYNIYFCPFCKKTNYGDGSPLAGSLIKCNFCSKYFCFVNCFYCKQIYFWKNSKKYIPCQTIICSNDHCRKKSALIQCPFCRKTNHFTKGVFTLGKEYGCSYHECKKEFIILYCGICNMTHIKNPNLDLDLLYKCDNCKNYMPTIQCPHCYRFCCLDNNKIKLDNISRIKCPYSSCGNDFYYYKCPFCRRDFNNTNFISKDIKCPFKKCNKTFSLNYFKCENCQRDNYLKVEMDIDNMNCEFCNANNNNIREIKNIEKIIEVKKANIVQGDKYIFDNPEEDPFDRKIIDSLIKSKLYEIIGRRINHEDEGNKEEKNCVICLINKVEWIIAPCGHKCLCSTCGVKYKEPNQKCPICKEPVIGILERVIDD